MERYNEYKDSGVQWLGEIPSHWDMQRWRFLLTENKVKNTDCKVKVQLQFKYGDIVRKANQDEDAGVLETISKYTVVAPDDIMINGLNLNYDFISQRVAQVRENGVITSAYVSLRPTSLACSRYYTYFLKSMDFKKMFHGMGTGIRLTLSYNELKNQFIPFPAIKEQQAIATYLDTATAKIDEAIAQQQKMIDLLNERKQIIINNAVTKGLNPDAPMKDSGVDWIGEIPEHWEVNKLKNCAKTNSGSTPRSIAGKENPTSTIRWVRTTDLHNNVVEDTSEYISEKEMSSASCPWLPVNTVLISMYGGAGSFGKVGLLNIEATINQALCSINCNSSILPKFMFYYLQSVHRIWMKYAASSRKDPNLNQEIIRNLDLVIPPLVEQEQIVASIESKLSSLETVIKCSEKQISLLQERKQIIINDVVTGKVKVS